MAKSPIEDAIEQIVDEKHISREAVLETIEAALAVAYRKDFGEQNQSIKAEFNPETAGARVFDVKEVVEDELFAEYQKQKAEAERLKAEEEATAAANEGTTKAPKSPPADGKEVPAALDVAAAPEGDEEKERRFDPRSMLSLSEAVTTKPDAKVGDIIKTELFPPESYGRMAAQTAKQVIIQRLREAEREMTFEEYKDKVGEILAGTIQRVEGRVVLVDLGHATAVMPPGEQIHRERYNPGQRTKVYLSAVKATTRGPEIVVSRAHPDMVRKLFGIEVPEVASGAIKIMAIAREAGSRTKIAVHTTEPNIDPVGSCVGQRGTRVQTVIAELGGEKIDIIQYEEDPVRYIISALSPAKVLSVQLHEADKRATAEVKEDQLSLAIGRAGQNVRLAAKLTGWKIDIVKESGVEEATPKAEGEQPSTEGATPTEEAPKPPADEAAPAVAEQPEGVPTAEEAPAEVPASEEKKAEEEKPQP